MVPNLAAQSDSDGLRSIGRPELIGLIRALFLERGVHATQVSRGKFVDLRANIPGIFDKPVKTLLRFFFEEISKEDFEDLRILRSQGNYGQILISTPAVTQPSMKLSKQIQLLSLDDVIESLKRSAFVSWAKGSSPRVRESEIAVASSWDRQLDALVSPALRWLPLLSRNKPVPFLPSTDSPDRLMERVVFKVLTENLRLRGESWGEKYLFQPRPDGWISWETGGALYDCKAAAEGYRMDAGDWRKFVDYCERELPELKRRGVKLTHVLVISSEFQGLSGARHPVHARAKTLHSKTGLRLSYLYAHNLALFARELDRLGATPDERSSIRWNELLSPLCNAQGFTAEIERIRGTRT